MDPATALATLRETLSHALLTPRRRAEAETALAALTREVTARQEQQHAHTIDDVRSWR